MKKWWKLNQPVPNVKEVVYPPLESAYIIDHREWAQWEEVSRQHPMVHFRLNNLGLTPKMLFLSDMWGYPIPDLITLVQRARVLHSVVFVDDRILTVIPPEAANLIVANSRKGSWFDGEPKEEVQPYLSRLPEATLYHNRYSRDLLSIRQRLENMGIPIDNAIWPLLTIDELSNLLTNPLPKLLTSHDYAQWIRTSISISEIEIQLY